MCEEGERRREREREMERRRVMNGDGERGGKRIETKEERKRPSAMFLGVCQNSGTGGC